ncbi:MAG: hypothetical protein GDA43_20105 [Hormoscilla sp. SP5CHS1]|nr:hypothetical protein [Hormoscilla sp. SP5CHS1]
MMEEFFEGKGNDKAQMVCFFENYVEGVKEFVPADKLLVDNVTEDWEPLCELLSMCHNKLCLGTCEVILP